MDIFQVGADNNSVSLEAHADDEGQIRLNVTFRLADDEVAKKPQRGLVVRPKLVLSDNGLEVLTDAVRQISEQLKNIDERIVAVEHEVCEVEGSGQHAGLLRVRFQASLNDQDTTTIDDVIQKITDTTIVYNADCTPA